MILNKTPVIIIVMLSLSIPSPFALLKLWKLTELCLACLFKIIIYKMRDVSPPRCGYADRKLFRVAR